MNFCGRDGRDPGNNMIGPSPDQHLVPDFTRSGSTLGCLKNIPNIFDCNLKTNYKVEFDNFWYEYS